MMTTLFVCVDGSLRSESILPVATGLVRAEGLSLWLLNVAGERPHNTTALQSELLHANYLRRVAHHRDDGITYHWAVLHHPRPDRAIVDHVADRGGIALTTHGAGGQLGGLGPVAARVLRRARGPVIVAPAMSQP